MSTGSRQSGEAHKTHQARGLLVGVLVGLAAGLLGCDTGSFVGLTEGFELAELIIIGSHESHVFTAPGQTLQLSGRAVDSSGTVVQGLTFHWSTSNGATATVDDMGLVTAKSAGTAAIILAAAGYACVDSVSVAVEDPALFYTTDFESDGVGSDPAGDGSFSWSSTSADVSSDLSRSGSNSLKFPVHGPSTQYNNEARWSMGRQVAEVWIEYYLYYPDGTEGIAGVGKYEHGEDPTSSDNDKFIRIFGDSYSDLYAKTGASTVPLNSGRDEALGFDYEWDGTVNTETIVQAPGHVNPWVDISWLAQWVQVRVYARFDDGSGNGEFKVWRNGELGMHVYNRQHASESHVDFWDRGYFFGSANSGAPRQSAIYMDDLKFYASDPGW